MKSNRTKQAIQNMNDGMSCSQAVLCAFCDMINMDERQAKRVALPYAGGSHIKCGALVSAEIVIEHLLEDGEMESAEGAAYLSEILEQEFFDRNQSIRCRELRGGFGQPMLRSCIGCVEDAAELLEQKIKSIMEKGKEA